MSIHYSSPWIRFWIRNDEILAKSTVVTVLWWEDCRKWCENALLHFSMPACELAAMQVSSTDYFCATSKVANFHARSQNCRCFLWSLFIDALLKFVQKFLGKRALKLNLLIFSLFDHFYDEWVATASYQFVTKRFFSVNEFVNLLIKFFEGGCYQKSLITKVVQNGS